MNVHRIRLRAPWRRDLLEAGSVRWTRTFHRPAGLSPAERVWLVVAPVPAGGDVRLNGHPLGSLDTTQATRLDITAMLTVSNTLELLCRCLHATAPEPPAAVHLEIG